MERMEYFLRRLLLIVPTFIGITLVCFTITQFVPGGPVEQMLGRMKSVGISEGGVRGGAPAAALTESYRRQIEAHFGFNRPFYLRYWDWLVHHRLGMKWESFKFPNKTAWQLIHDRFGVSLVFGLTGFLLSYMVCIPLGIAKALRHGSRFDLLTSVGVFVGYAVPPLALGMVLKMLFCGTVDGLWDVFPLSGFQSDGYAALSLTGKVADILRHMALPVLCYIIGDFAVLTVLMKNSLLDQVSSDYVRTVLAKGGSYRRAIWGHALRNSMIPIATGFGGIMTVLFAGSVIIEQIFEIPGMGRLGLEALVGRDYPVFMGIVALTSLLGLIGNVLSDFCYVLIDPRIDFQK
jgi:microcin C transport system permease protein